MQVTEKSQKRASGYQQGNIRVWNVKLTGQLLLSKRVSVSRIFSYDTDYSLTAFLHVFGDSADQITAELVLFL